MELESHRHCVNEDKSDGGTKKRWHEMRSDGIRKGDQELRLIRFDIELNRVKGKGLRVEEQYPAYRSNSIIVTRRKKKLFWHKYSGTSFILLNAEACKYQSRARTSSSEPTVAITIPLLN